MTYKCVDYNSLRRMKLDHLNMKLIGTFEYEIYVSIMPNIQKERFFQKKNLKIVEVSLRCWLKKSRTDIWIYTEIWVRQNAFTTLYQIPALYQILYLALLCGQIMIFSPKLLAAVRMRCAYALKSLFIQLFSQTVSRTLARIFFSVCIYVLTFIAISMDYDREKRNVEIFIKSCLKILQYFHRYQNPAKVKNKS